MTTLDDVFKTAKISITNKYIPNTVNIEESPSIANVQKWITFFDLNNPDVSRDLVDKVAYIDQWLGRQKGVKNVTDKMKLMHKIKQKMGINVPDRSTVKQFYKYMRLRDEANAMQEQADSLIS
jgi:hypothetical protein